MNITIGYGDVVRVRGSQDVWKVVATVANRKADLYHNGNIWTAPIDSLEVISRHLSPMNGL